MGKGTRVIVKQQKAAPNPMAAMLKSIEEEDEDLPPLPDKNVSLFWPNDRGYINTNDWVVVWPNYIDKGKTISKGRRVKTSESCERPIPIELSAICKAFDLWHVLEPFKGYPREPFVLGRVRVRIYLPNGVPAHPEIPTKSALLVKMGTLIPSLHIRHERLLLEQEAAKSGGSIASKKKGRKNR